MKFIYCKTYTYVVWEIYVAYPELFFLYSFVCTHCHIYFSIMHVELQNFKFRSHLNFEKCLLQTSEVFAKIKKGI